MAYSEDYIRFWKEKEEKLGSKILFKTSARIGTSDKSAEDWGLVYGTEQVFCIEFFQKQSWMAGLFGKGAVGENRCTEIHYEQIKSIEFIPPRKFLKFLQLTFGRIEITFNEEIVISKTISGSWIVLLPLEKIAVLQKQIPPLS